MTKHDRTKSIVVALSVAAFFPVAAQAQMRGGGGGGPTPVGTPLDKIPVGTWAEYSVTRGDQPPRKMRHALVGKEGAAFILETSSESPRGKTLVRTVVAADPSAEGAVKKVIMQTGDSDPMEMPTARSGGPGGGGPSGGGPGGGGPGAGGGPEGRGGPRGGGASFIKPDPKKLVGKETLKLAAGTFQTEHYRDAGPRGGTIDFWIAKDAGPFGLVKMQMDRPGGPDGDAGAKTTTELSARGKDAKPQLTKPAKPFDPSAMQGMRGPGRDGAGAGGPGTPAGADQASPPSAGAPAPKK